MLLVQDGVRMYHDGDATQPVRDLEDEPDDAGQRRPSLADPAPGTPLIECAPGDA